jgi:ABC-type dipeptide/oligopeptide/nickel transport system permease component
MLIFPTLVGVSLVIFLILELAPGDPLAAVMSEQYGHTAEDIEKVRDQLHLNDALHVRYLRFLLDAMRGDLGKSFRGGTPVLTDILDRLPSTLALGAVGLALTMVLGISAGILAALYRGTAFDKATMAFAFIGVSIPSVYAAILLLLIFAVGLGWFKVVGDQGLKSLILPAIALSLIPIGVLARLTRASMLEVMDEDYVRTARAKGVQELLVILRHVFRNALVPIVTYLGLLAGGLLSGQVFVENVFGRPGLGRFLVDAISARDYPQIRGGILFVAFGFVCVNLLVDLLYGVIDPRISYD